MWSTTCSSPSAACTPTAPTQPSDSAINDLTFKGHVYKGKLPPPKGQSPEEWEDREQTLFRSTEVGDDIDRPLIKSDGSYTYFAADVAYFRDKFERGFLRDDLCARRRSWRLHQAAGSGCQGGVGRGGEADGAVCASW
jgi:hypothetical protein